MNFQHHSLTT